MASATVVDSTGPLGAGLHTASKELADPFVEAAQLPESTYGHRYSGLVNPDSIALGATGSPANLKRTILAHLAETERRLQDAQKLGESLLSQQSELTDKLREVEQHEGDAEISPELRQRLVDLEKEHNDVGREIARALLGPKSRAVSGEDKPATETSTLTSHATASPTKVMAPSRRQRNQPGNRTGDLQFAADIGTSLLAQVRQLQSAVAERDELLKAANSDRDRLEQDAAVFTQRLRALDESEQKYKDENWNLETQTHELHAAVREAADREKRIAATLAATKLDKSRAQSEMDEIRLAHEKLAEEHAAAKKAHDSELHALKRTLDIGENDRSALQSKIEELTSQNQELAQAVAARLRPQQPDTEISARRDLDDDPEDFPEPEHSPPPSPTKATPRHGGLESETLRSSLHHAHRMIQNLKNNIHREKTEKIELKRMLQDARDELEQRRGDGPLGSGSKRQKSKPDTFKKPVRPDMLGGTRRSHTDIEMEDDDWEDHVADTPTHSKQLSVPSVAKSQLTDMSDAYHTATEAEGTFDTADEKHATESDDFQTGAESLAGDSTDDLTETEDTASNARRRIPSRAIRPSLVFKPAGNRESFASTASTSAGEEEEDELRTPVLTSTHKFRLKNGRQSLIRQSRVPTDSTPTNIYSDAVSQDSPATVSSERSLPGAEQSLFAELGGMSETGSFGTPGRSSIASATSTPGALGYTPSIRTASQPTPLSKVQAVMVDSATMTEPWKPELDLPTAASPVRGQPSPLHNPIRTPLPSEFPLPPTVPTSPIKHIDNGTQYTPQRALQESPLRGTAFITPPKTVWDEAQSPEMHQPEQDATPRARTPTQFDYSGLLMHDTIPITPEKGLQFESRQSGPLTFSDIQSQVTAPVQTPEKPLDTAIAPAQIDESSGRPTTAEKFAGTGLLASAAAALGFARAKETSVPTEQEEKIVDPPGSASHDETALDTQSKGMSTQEPASAPGEDRATPVSLHDQASQTLLTAAQIERALQPALVIPAPLPPSSETSQSATNAASPLESSSPVKRQLPISAQRLSLNSGPHPPLPPDHKAAIAKASGRITSPTRESAQSSHVPTVMGPPALPASAMRRPKTPGESIRSPTRESNAARNSTISRSHRGTITSQRSRRSSVSSFASELDERFNMHAPQGDPHGFGTDPRMIQAITQTMIGEFLWKYTRKAGRSEMSESRHRRYFWVHPYTKTLYWSDQDPQAAGRSELRAKSVLIESVRVISDDNPMPPGLHRKSLEVTTPGRRLRFTASTGQRHETWFNALTYLLHRGEDPVAGAERVGDQEITRNDIDEFNVNAGGYGATLAPSGSRMSLSSYNSRTTRGTSSNRNSAAQRQLASNHESMNDGAHASTQDSVASRNIPGSTLRRGRNEHTQDADKDRTLRASSASRFSRMIGSVTGRTRSSEAAMTRGSAASEGGSIYDASVVSDGRLDSAEELRREMLRQEEIGLGGLENVRACCDGKHDVSTLSHSHRHASSRGHAHRSLSMSLRGAGRRGGPGSTPWRSSAAVTESGTMPTPTRPSATAAAQ